MIQQATRSARNATEQPQAKLVSPRNLVVRNGFSARQFRQEDFEGFMDPLIMVDDYTMTEPTFGAHPHAGIAAVSLLFEETEGLFFNHDSLGNHLALQAGDLYWLNAGKGAMHDESPLPGEARIRGLQMFIKLPAEHAAMAPSSSHLPAGAMPHITAPGVRVRVAAGSSNGKSGFNSAPVPVTLLDGRLDGGAQFNHQIAEGESVWLYAVEGEVVLSLGGEEHRLQSGQAIAVRTEAIQEVHIRGVRRSHFVLVAAQPLNEAFVHRGPFALANESEIAQAQADAEAGRMGLVERKPVTNLQL